MPERRRQNVKLLDCQHAAAALAKTDKKLAALMKKVGPCQLRINHMQSSFEALAESIVYQQLTGKAAGTIYGRLKQHFGEDELLAPEKILAVDDSVLRGVGLSGAKTAALKDLSNFACAGKLPSVDELDDMDDDDIAESLVAIRGIGRWTVDMLLIFRLGRLDVLPSTDYGVRKGFARTYGHDELPAPKAIALHAEKWKPYRSVASWYMWRALELS